MNIRKNGTTWTMELMAECTIIDVQTDLDQVRDLPNSLKKINLKCGAVNEIDTAYFQFLLALKAGTMESGVEFQVHEPSEIIRQVETLFGVLLSTEAEGVLS